MVWQNISAAHAIQSRILLPLLRYLHETIVVFACHCFTGFLISEEIGFICLLTICIQSLLLLCSVATFLYFYLKSYIIFIWNKKTDDRARNARIMFSKMNSFSGLGEGHEALGRPAVLAQLGRNGGFFHSSRERAGTDASHKRDSAVAQLIWRLSCNTSI